VTFNITSHETVRVAKKRLQNSQFFNALLFSGFKKAESDVISMPELEMHMLKVGFAVRSIAIKNLLTIF
jgi:hypothetical protein